MTISFDGSSDISEMEMRRAAVKAIRKQVEQVATFGTPVSPVLDAVQVKAPIPDENWSDHPVPMQAAGMIFLRRNDAGWLVRFIGMVGMSANELPIPGDRTRKLPDVLAYLKAQHGAKLAGAWLLVAP